jgi:hypothetical protein
MFIPGSWDRFPFLILVCRGNHTHFPPPPTKLPGSIRAQIVEAITPRDSISLTARNLMISPLFNHLRGRHNGPGLRALHWGLHIEDRITGLIRTQRLLHYPQGTDIAGVWREFCFDKAKPIEEQWIRDVHFFDQERQRFLIICCTYEQAKLFQTVRHIEMDLAFKMVSGKTMVFTIVGWNAKANSK